MRGDLDKFLGRLKEEKGLSPTKRFTPQETGLARAVFHADDCDDKYVEVSESTRQGEFLVVFRDRGCAEADVVESQYLLHALERWIRRLESSGDWGRVGQGRGDLRVVEERQGTMRRRETEKIPLAAHYYATLFAGLRERSREVRDASDEVGKARETCFAELAELGEASAALGKMLASAVDLVVPGRKVGEEIRRFQEKDVTRVLDRIDDLRSRLQDLHVAGTVFNGHLVETGARLGKIFALKLARHCYATIVADGGHDARPFKAWWLAHDATNLARLVTGVYSRTTADEALEELVRPRSDLDGELALAYSEADSEDARKLIAKRWLNGLYGKTSGPNSSVAVRPGRSRIHFPDSVLRYAVQDAATTLKAMEFLEKCSEVGRTTLSDRRGKEGRRVEEKR